MDNEIDRNKKNFVINIIDKELQDTVAVLHPDKDDLNYQFLTPLGVNHLVYESTLQENEDTTKQIRN